MEWILPVLVETRSVHQDILADRQAIAQAQGLRYYAEGR